MFPKRRYFVVRRGRATRGAHIEPEFIARAEEHLRDTGEPLLEAPQGAEAFLFARSDLDYELYLGDPYDQAALYCRAAIRIDPGRHNAHKNLGLALRGLGEVAEAAENLLTAAHIQPGDQRALRHLEELFAEFPGLEDRVCRAPRRPETGP